MTITEILERFGGEKSEWVKTRQGGHYHKPSCVITGSKLRTGTVVRGSSLSNCDVSGATIIDSTMVQCFSNGECAISKTNAFNTSFLGKSSSSYARIFNSTLRQDASVFGAVDIDATVITRCDLGGFSYVQGAVDMRNVTMSGRTAVANSEKTPIKLGTDDTPISLVGGHVVKGGTWNHQPIYISARPYALYQSLPGYISIGCKTLTIDEWISLGPIIARREGFSAHNIQRYGLYIKLIQEIDGRILKQEV